MMAWINRLICRFFGHKWSEWHESIGFGDWPTKTRVCHRCGKIHEIDAIEPINCRCWVAYQDQEKLK